MRRPTRYSIYALEPINRALAPRIAHNIHVANLDQDPNFRSRSRVFATIAERYDLLMQRCLPHLPLWDWQVVFSALKGIWVKDDPVSVTDTLPDRIREYCDTHGEHLHEHLLDVLDALDLPGRLAIIDAAERFWLAEAGPAGGSWRAAVRAVVGHLQDD